MFHHLSNAEICCRDVQIKNVILISQFKITSIRLSKYFGYNSSCEEFQAMRFILELVVHEQAFDVRSRELSALNIFGVLTAT